MGTVRSLFDIMNFHEIGGTLILNVEENALISTMESDFDIFHSFNQNLELKFLLFWIRAKNATKNGRYFRHQKNVEPDLPF